MLFTTSQQLASSKDLITAYKTGKITSMTPELWTAKKRLDATLHPDTGEPVLLPFRMSAYVLTNLVVTAGMLTPGLSTAGTLGWQIANQSLNVGINASNANKSSPLSYGGLAQSYAMAVSASCGVAYGLNSLVPRMKRLSPAAKVIAGRLVPFAAVASAGVLNVFLMRSEEIKKGIDVFSVNEDGSVGASIGKSKTAATLAVGETAASRVINATPIMVLPPLVLVRLQKTEWLKQRPKMVMPNNLALILGTSLFALPLALGIFPQRQRISVGKLEEELWASAGGKEKVVEFNRGI